MLTAVEWLIGAVFVTTSVIKLLRFPLFVGSVLDYRIVRQPRHAFAVALTIVVLELGIGAALLCQLQPFAAGAAAGLLAVFTMIVAFCMVTGRRPRSCGCVPARTGHFVGWYLCLRNASLVVVLLPSVGITSAFSGIVAAVFLGTGAVGAYVIERAWKPKAAAPSRA